VKQLGENNGPRTFAERHGVARGDKTKITPNGVWFRFRLIIRKNGWK